MQKQTKNIITREWVEKELRLCNTADIRSALVLCGAVAPLCILLAVGGVCLVIAACDALVLRILMSVIWCAPVSAPLLYFLWELCQHLTERKWLRDGAFEISIRRVLYKEEKLVYRHLAKVLRFEDFGETTVDKTEYGLTSVGDEYYIVYYTPKNKMRLHYARKLYEYKER